MARFAADRPVFYVEEPVDFDGVSHLAHRRDESGVVIVTPHLGPSVNRPNALSQLISRLIGDYAIGSYALWYYTPEAITWTRQLAPAVVVYDCMDELSAFKGASSKIPEWESELLARADLVFAGGRALFEAKRRRHAKVYPFPSAVDVFHFAKALVAPSDPKDQAVIPRPRLGYAGVIDERMDLELIAAIADARPDWQLIMIGPVVKIDLQSLPQRANIHYLGMKQYAELPSYMGYWDVALLPFALNESTRYISPTKTPEYLAAGLPVVSTPVPDVVDPYGSLGVAHIAHGAEEFVRAIERALQEDSKIRRDKVDKLLSKNSWSNTWGRMNELIEDAMPHGDLPSALPPYAAESKAAVSRART